MLFFDASFLFVFLPLTLVGHIVLPERARNAFLLMASCVFYAASSLEYLPILLFSVAIDFVAAPRIAAASSHMARRAWLLLSLCTNLGLLGFFKYAGLLTFTLRDQLGMTSVPLLQAALPVGISFYTFQSVSYSIDVYRGHVTPTRRVADFGAYVTMFPQLIAGPIVRYADIERQLRARRYDERRVAEGVMRFVIGLAKKLLVADTLADLGAPRADPGLLGAWATMFFFAGQIYFDFSGYSDMAIGLGKLFGFDFPENFDSPYRATSFSDFWRRWHITLSTWLRDYLYIPLGGNRRGAVRTYAHLMITMLLGGLWHGASWNFVLWGFAHGLLLSLERIVRSALPGLAPPASVRRALVFLVVTLVWVPFRFEHPVDTSYMVMHMFGAGGLGSLGPVDVAALLALGGLLWIPQNSGRAQLEFSPRQTAWAAALLVAALFVGYGRLETSPFLYFRF